MDISRKTKKMLLFVSTENPLFSDLFELFSEGDSFVNVEEEKAKKSKSPIWSKAAFNLTPQTISGWINKQPKRTAGPRVDETFDHAKKCIAKNTSEQICEQMCKKVDDFRALYENNDIPTYTAAESLGFTLSQVRKILDSYIYSKYPVFNNIFYKENESDTLADDFSWFSGMYNVYVKRGDQLFIKCTMTLRYILEIKNGKILRCKMNFPMLFPTNQQKAISLKKHEELKLPPRTKAPIPFWNYDGVLRIRDKHAYWVFEKRGGTRPDYFYFITGLGVHRPGKFSNTLMIWGTYLTTGQDQYQTIVSSDICLEHVAKEDPKLETADPEAAKAITDLIQNQMRSSLDIIYRDHPDFESTKEKFNQWDL